MLEPSPTNEPPVPLLLETAVHAARQAGKVLSRYVRDGFRVENKSAIDLVTEADHAAEQCVIDVILASYPDHAFLAEERGRIGQTQSPYVWIIDPLDGTTNFTHGFPTYCVSIGLEYKEQCVLGVVYDPTRDELFSATRGGGARVNGQPLHVSQTAQLDQALLVTGFAYNIRETPNNNLDHFARFALLAQGLRRTGSAALDLCYVAAGRFDGFWEVKLSPWDTAAGVVILREAGGRVTDFCGQSHSLYGQELVASNGHLHDSMISVIRESQDGRPPSLG
ncbi:MAG: inositol monophosphatase family protein [Nitrospira sp.]|nr:inositol monophosphatase family protein [Nitrospira sp.]